MAHAKGNGPRPKALQSPTKAASSAAAQEGAKRRRSGRAKRKAAELRRLADLDDAADWAAMVHRALAGQHCSAKRATFYAKLAELDGSSAANHAGRWSEALNAELREKPQQTVRSAAIRAGARLGRGRRKAQQHCGRPIGAQSWKAARQQPTVKTLQRKRRATKIHSP